MYSDAHIHILDTIEELISNGIPDAEEVVFRENILFCASADTAQRFEMQEKICRRNSQNFILSFGVHPQNPVTAEIPFLEELIYKKRIAAIGECGFDLFNKNYAANFEAQKTVWNIQLGFAQKAGLPIVVHCRKALHLLFAATAALKKLPAVIFHGWAGSKTEAESFLKKGVNAYFCIGKGLLRGQKAQIEICRHLTQARLLTETDAPYMTLKGEPYSPPADIKKVSAEAVKTRLNTSIISDKTIEEFNAIIYKNFKRAYLM